MIYTPLLNPRGGIECDVTVTRLAGDCFLMISGTALNEHELAWLRLHQPAASSLIVQDVTSSQACIGLWGPQARAILERVTRDDVSNEGFPYMTAREIHVGHVPTLALRVTYVGELGWEIYCPMEYGQSLWNTLWEAGQPEGLAPVDYRAIDSMRLEKGYRSWGADISPDYTPFEAGLGFVVRLDKGDFVGREALVQQKAKGIQRKLCCLTLTDPAQVPIGKEPIRLRGKDDVVSWVTSAGYGYAVGKSITYSYLPLDLAETGRLLEVEILGERIGAMVEREPLWDPRGAPVKE